ncbi:family 2 glycosyl transferase [Actinoplanes sp. SE50]|uniref:glycosyltransferase family 2 protein n=1 Tax=unclassified Actinoplanes TaxID=2626549 RepID=UPI00023EBD2B|nr:MULTISPECIES: glycosyltransferase family A protein [unclassified Actinoplanes]AEV84008.1 glycosyl transferase family 2 [Actinoplanes sp. SE50/110]ATO82401.1 family 2 glycosyl transferase [Actinoplanes sp. SE50]SLL99808.1 family 2 glycosyl transferase [Actinoplanes sp. SE50/110]
MPSLKKRLRDRYGWLPLEELRNKVVLGHTAVGLARFERAEVRRLLPTLPGGVRPRARVAVIVLTYQRADGLARAVESVLAQTMKDLVLIVVDDAGGQVPDLPPDPRLHTVALRHNINVPGVGRNVGIGLTDSDHVAFLDDDNTWDEHHLETALARLDGPAAPNRPDAVYTAMRRIMPDGTVRDVLSVPFDRRLAWERCYLDNNPLVLRRLPATRFSRLRRTTSVAPKEDWELVYRFSRRHRVEHIPEPTVNYTINPDSYWTPWELP